MNGPFNAPVIVGFKTNQDYLNHTNGFSPTLTMALGSSAYVIDAFNSSTVLLDGIGAPQGFRAPITAHDSSTAIMSSGTIGSLGATDNGTAIFVGGKMGAGTASGAGTFIATGGTINGLAGSDYGSLTTTGTNLFEGIYLRGSSTATMTGGSISSGFGFGVVQLKENSIATLSGVAISGSVTVEAQSAFNLIGGSVEKDITATGGSVTLTSSSAAWFSKFEKTTVNLTSAALDGGAWFIDSNISAAGFSAISGLSLDRSTMGFSDLVAGRVSLTSSEFIGSGGVLSRVDAILSVVEVAGTTVTGSAVLSRGTIYSFDSGSILGSLSSDRARGTLGALLVGGNSTFQNGSSLDGTSVTFAGSFKSTSTDVRLYDTTIGGSLSADFASEFQFSRGTVGGSASAYGSQFWLSNVEIGGDLTVVSGDLNLDRSKVGRSLTSISTKTQISDSQFDRDGFIGAGSQFDIGETTFGESLSIDSSEGLLKHVSVAGNLDIGAGTTIDIDSSPIGGNLSMGENSLATIRDTSIGGRVDNNYGLSLDIGSTSEGTIGKGASVVGSTMTLTNLAIGEDVQALAQSNLYLQDTKVGGSFTLLDSLAEVRSSIVLGDGVLGQAARFLSVDSRFNSLFSLDSSIVNGTDSTIDGDLTVMGAGSLTMFGSTIGGNVALSNEIKSVFQDSSVGGTFTSDNAGPLEMGSTTINGATNLIGTQGMFTGVNFMTSLHASGKSELLIKGGTILGDLSLDKSSAEVETSVTGNVIAAKSDLIVSGGSIAGNVFASGQTYSHELATVGGRVATSEDVDGELLSGDFGSLSAEGTSELYLRSGTVIGDAEVSGDAYLINQSAIAGDGIASGNGHMRMYDGLIAGNLIARDTASIIVYDGVIGGQIFASGNSTIIVRGVSYGDGQGGQGFMDTSLDDGLATLTDQAKILFVGNGLGAELVDGSFDGLYSKYALTGNLANGSDLSGHYFYVLNGSGASYELQAVPEPGTMSLAAGLGIYGLAKRRRQKRQAV